MNRKIDFCTETERCAYCSKWPYHLQYKSARCETKDCPQFKKRFANIDAWNLGQRLIVQAAVKICREMGITRTGV